MKIALISDGIYPYVIGGMQKHSSSIGVELVKLGHSVDLYHFVLKGNSIPTTDEVNRFHFNSTNGFNKTYCLYFPTSIRFPGHYLWNSYRYSKSIFEIIKNNNTSYDFIYSKGFSSWRLLQKRKALRIKPKIGVKFHGYEMYQYAPNFKIKVQHLMLRPFVKMINRKADLIFSYGSKITEIIADLGVNKSKILEIPSAISSNWVNKNRLSISNNIKFLFVGRFERRKGIEEINKAILNLSNFNINSEFHFVGSIPIKNRLKSNKIRVVYHGEIIDEQSKISIYDNCDVLLCPSYSEGMPNVILEAMSRGLIIIATDVGAVNVLVSSKNGILIKNPKHENILDAMKILLKTENEILLKMKNFSVEMVKSSFIWEKVINHTTKIILSSFKK